MIPKWCHAFYYGLVILLLCVVVHPLALVADADVSFAVDHFGVQNFVGRLCLGKGTGVMALMIMGSSVGFEIRRVVHDSETLS